MGLKKLGKFLGTVGLDILGDTVKGIIPGSIDDKIIDSIKEKVGLEPSSKEDDIIAKLQNNPEMQKALLEFETENKRMLLDAVKAQFADKDSARKMRTSDDTKFGDKLAMQIMTWNLPGIAILFLLNVAMLVLSKKLNLDPAIILSVGNILGMIIQSLLNERKEVVGFHFGSSIGSKLKDSLVKGDK
jgi:hypothetical protein